MSVSNSKTDIVNLTLDIIKTENINDVEIPAGDKIAVVANRWFDDVLANCLEGFPWNFAATRKAIPLSGTDPLFGFDDAYVLPSNYLSLNWIKYWDYPLSKWSYMVEDGKIYIDNGGASSLNIGYTYFNVTVAKYSPSFKIYLAYALAERVVYKLTGNANLQTRLQRGKQTEMVNAKAKNGKANPPVAYRESKMLNARRTYGGSRTTGLYLGRNGRA